MKWLVVVSALLASPAVGRGLAGPETMMEIYASTETGTWTVTMTMANGTMCMVASGQGYEAVLPRPAGTEG
jgi:hypothetical protein